MAEIEYLQYSTPFLRIEDDIFDYEAVTSMSSARCGLSKQWLGAYPGEKVTLVHPQKSVRLDPTNSLWYESMQDMSGFVLPDTILPPLDEQLTFSNSTAQTENDFYVQNPGLPSPAEFILREGVTNEDSDMFDNSNWGTLDSITECCPESSIKQNSYDFMNSDNTRTINMSNEDKNFSTQKTSYCRQKAKLAATVKKEKPRYLAIIDSEEPLIKEDPELLYFTDENKMDFDIKADVDVLDIFSSEEPRINEDMKVYYSTDFKDMDVAEEVTIMTEEEDRYKTNSNIPLLESVSSDTEEDLNISENKIKEETEVVFQLDPFSSLETVMGNLFNDLDEIGDDLYSHIGDPVTPDEIEEDYRAISSETDFCNRTTNDMLSHLQNNTSSTSNKRTSHLQNDTSHQTNPQPLFSSTNCQVPPRSVSKNVPLTLDIEAARTALLVGKGISDTPELLEVLKPEIGKFDLIKFITTNGDPNNNAISPTEESHSKKPEAPRKGKSHLSLVDLKQAQLGQGKPLLRIECQREVEPLPSTSGTSLSGRPARQSATRFKKLIEEGLLSSAVYSRTVSSDDEDDGPKIKRRRTTSTTSSRRRLNSDSDRSSVSEDAMKYRERRDRNNLSSKRSRQKRKMHHQMKQKELKELENENARLKSKSDELESVLKRVKAAWAEYLVHMKDNDKDRGDEH